MSISIRHPMTLFLTVSVLIATYSITIAHADTPPESAQEVWLIGNLFPAGAMVPADQTASLHADDARLMVRSAQKVLESKKDHSTLRWENALSGHSGSVTPVATYWRRGAPPCRLYIQTLKVDDATEHKARAVACRLPSGFWRVVK